MIDMNLFIDTQTTLFATDEEYNRRRDYLVELQSVCPEYADRIRRHLFLSDTTREEYRSDPDELERIRKRMEVDARIRKANRVRREVLTVLTLYDIMHDTDEQYQERKDRIAEDIFVDDQITEALLQRIIEGLDDLRETYKDNDRMLEIVEKLKPEKED